LSKFLFAYLQHVNWAHNFFVVFECAASNWVRFSFKVSFFCTFWTLLVPVQPNLVPGRTCPTL